MLLASSVVVVGGVCVQGFETSWWWRIVRLGCVINVRVRVGVLTYDGINCRLFI
jgi:hypothetical protein